MSDELNTSNLLMMIGFGAGAAAVLVPTAGAGVAAAAVDDALLASVLDVPVTTAALAMVLDDICC